MPAHQSELSVGFNEARRLPFEASSGWWHGGQWWRGRHRPARRRPARSGPQGIWLLQQALLQHIASPLEILLPVNLRRASGQAVAQVLERIAGHVRALVAGARDAGHRMIAMLREAAL